MWCTVDMIVWTVIPIIIVGNFLVCFGDICGEIIVLLHKIIIKSVSRTLFLFICSPRSYALCTYTFTTVINNGQKLVGICQEMFLCQTRQTAKIKKWNF